MNIATNVSLPAQGSDALGIEKLPTDFYVCENHYRSELENVFSKCWLMVGRETDLAKSGDFFTYKIDALSVSIIVVRGKDGIIRAFRNACTHRGTKIVTEERGRLRGGMICPYHGWAFGLDGDLLNVPDEETFGCLDKDNEGLHTVSLDKWGGFIFINLDPHPQWSLKEYLAPLGEDLIKYVGDEQWTWSFGWKSRVKSNWKSPVDAQVEGYHITYGHRRTISRNVTAETTRPYINPGSIGVPGGHHLFRPEKLGEQTPIGLLAARYGATSLYAEPEKEFAANNFDQLAFSQHPRWILDGYLLFPNTVLFVQKGQLFIQRTLPLSPHECLWEVDFYHSEKPQKFGEKFNHEQGRIQIRDVLSEDLKIVEGIQENYRSGAIKEMNLSRQEVIIRAYYHSIRQFVEEGSSR
ncbi:MAG: aromatic ring-hydroxylating dioxygenase subunit alpha [Novosphingobium sp.]|nr:aromatic ring-hydroxylating dioxygenase subunit alpha [Novosphingobium sp.]